MSMENTDSAGSVGTVDSDAGVSTSDLDSRGPALSNRKQTERIIPEGIKCYNLESELPMQREATGSIMLQIAVSSRLVEPKKLRGGKVRDPQEPLCRTTIWIQVLAAENLLPAPHRVGDPYVEAEVIDISTLEPLQSRPLRYRTNAAQGTVNPIWNEYVLGGLTKIDSASLGVRLRVLDEYVQSESEPIAFNYTAMS